MNPTEEQAQILDFVAKSNQSLMIQALAGTGKSATLKMIDAEVPGPHLYLVFNKMNKEEAQASGGFKTTTTIKTFNGLGHCIWADACGRKLALNPKKINEIFKVIVDESHKSQRNHLWNLYDSVRSGVDMARALGYIPSGHAKQEKRLCDLSIVARVLDEYPHDDALSLIDEILRRSIRQAYDGLIDFPDQLYMPAIFGGTYPRFPLVLIDEYQDLSPINHAMIAKLCRSSRQIGVGDDAQAIYGFRGAVEDSMSQAMAKFDMAQLPLSTSFRCPSKIVENVHWRVPNYKSTRDGGMVTIGRQLEPGTVICRNNAPLFSLAVKRLIAGDKVDIAGVDLTNRLLHIMSRLGPDDMTQGQTLSAIESWFAEHEDSKSSADLAECMRVFAKASKSLSVALATIRHLAAQTGEIKFLTGHKAKGMEWENVYHLDRWLLKDRQGQDANLEYVIDTRSKEKLTYIDTKEVQ